MADSADDVRSSDDLTEDELANLERGLAGESADETEETTEETKEETTEEPEATDETSTEDKSTETEETADADEDADGDEAGSDEEADKPEITKAERNRMGYAERQAMRSQVAAGTPGAKTAEQLVDEGVDEARAETQALRDEIARDKYVNEITELNLGLESEARNAMRDFPVFDASSPDYDEGFTKEVESLYQEVAQIKLDESGKFVVQANAPLYKFYALFGKTRTEAANAARAAAEVEAQRNAEATLSATEEPASTPTGDRSTKPPTEEELLIAALAGKPLVSN